MFHVAFAGITADELFTSSIVLDLGVWHIKTPLTNGEPVNENYWVIYVILLSSLNWWWYVVYGIYALGVISGIFIFIFTTPKYILLNFIFGLYYLQIEVFDAAIKFRPDKHKALSKSFIFINKPPLVNSLEGT